MSKENNPTITLIVSIRAKHEYRETVKARLIDLANKTRLESGNLFYILHESINQQTVFMIYERWVDQGSLDKHMSEDYLQSFLEDSKTWLTEDIASTSCCEIL